MCHNNPRMTVDYNSITLLHIKGSTSENSNLINTLQRTFKGRYDLGNMRCFGEYEWKKVLDREGMLFKSKLHSSAL